MDLASLFYILGIVFFFTFFVILVVLLFTILRIYGKVNKFRSQLPTKVISYLQQNNSAQLKALGISIVGYILNFFKGKMQGRKAK